MLPLRGDVALHRNEVRLSDGKRAVTRLPLKAAPLSALSLDPLRRAFLYFLYYVSNCPCPTEGEERVDMVGRAAHQQRRRVAFAENGGQISVQLGFDLRLDERLTSFRTENEVNKNRRQ